MDKKHNKKKGNKNMTENDVLSEVELARRAKQSKPFQKMETAIKEDEAAKTDMPVMENEELPTETISEIPPQQEYKESEVKHKLSGLLDSAQARPNLDLTKSSSIKEFLLSIYDEPLGMNPGIGTEHYGFIDDTKREKLNENIKSKIHELISKLYRTKVKKVAIVGTAYTYRLAPYDDPSWELWGLNDHWNNMPRATRWFEANYESACVTPVSHKPNINRIDWLRKCPIPVYMEKHYDDVPMSIRYPYEEINDYISHLDPCGRDYFTNSVSFMIALAMYEGFDIIHLYGVDMAVGSEYEHQRPSCEFWVGICKGLGIELYIPEQSDLLKTMAVYGRGRKQDAFMKKMFDRRAYQQNQVAGIDTMIKQRQDEIQRLAATKFQYQGSLADIEQTLKVWGQI